MLSPILKKAFALSVLLTMSGFTYAGCSNSLPYDELIDCITAEGAGQNYDDYLKETTISQNDEKDKS